MTNLTSERFRDVLHNLDGYTTETPNVQSLTRRAVEVFYTHFGCYPDVAGAAPGSASIFGEQTQFDGGIALTLPTPMATVIVGRKFSGNRVTIVTTADIEKPHKVTFTLSKCPLSPGDPMWVNHIKGVMAMYCCRTTVTGFQAAIVSSIPLGVGLGSAAALEVAMFTFLEILFGDVYEPFNKAFACQIADEDFLDRRTGCLSYISSSLAQDRQAALIDPVAQQIQWLPFRNQKVVFLIINSHQKDLLFGNEYPDRTSCLKKACSILSVDNLRKLGVEDLEALENKITSIKNQSNDKILTDEDWNYEKLDLVLKRTKFFVTEMERIQEATEAWDEGNIITFGRKMIESHRSLKEDFGFSNPLLEFFVEMSLELEGVLGSKMIGCGLDQGGAVITLIYKESLQSYCEQLLIKFNEHKAEIWRALRQKREGHLRGASEQNVQNEQEMTNQISGIENLTGQEDLIEKDLQNAEEVTVKKKKKKCDPSRKRKKKMTLEEQSKWLEEHMEDEENTKRIPCSEDGKQESGLQNNDELQKNIDALEKSAEQKGMGKEDSIIMDLKDPTFYILNPISGARMMFPLKLDLLRSRYARRIPQAKELVREALVGFYEKCGKDPEGIGLAPATTTLFGEFLEFSMGYVISMALPLLTVTVGRRNDCSWYSIKTLSQEVMGPSEFEAPVPCAGAFEEQAASWINHAAATVSDFKGHVPGFVAVVSSSIPCEIGVHSCSAFQGSICEFLEGLTKICTEEPLEKIERYQNALTRIKHDSDLTRDKCSFLRFIPTFLCKEGYVLLINCKTLKMAHYYLDHPSYAFMLASCRGRSTTITVEDLAERMRMCHEAAEILGQESLTNADERHLRCLMKRGAPDVMVRRARYIITEQQRSVRAIKAIKEDDYEILGMLMTQSHCSLRDDFEVSSPEIEVIINLALTVEGVLGAKLTGKGLTSTVLILARLESVDRCIKHVRKNYMPRQNKPFFYVFRPSSGAYTMNLDDVLLIP